MIQNYDEVGHPKRIDCLKYLVLSKMLSLDEVNIFDAPEVYTCRLHHFSFITDVCGPQVKPYRADSQITAMTDLMAAYQADDIKQFHRILSANKKSIQVCSCMVGSLVVPPMWATV